ncbi:MAG: hypothetical protein ABS917_03490 [Solibacillus sp.]|uniref:hypothetical protein n=1 Tax=Solibacillus sp. TaxID=1909654 RepID=UPI0033160F31
MATNTIEMSEKKKEQTATVRKQFVNKGIDLSLLDAGVSLFSSLEQALKRTKNDKSYIVKGIEYRLNLVEKDGKQIKLAPRYALINVIQTDNELWQLWIKQQEIFNRTGLEADKPSIHRPNPDGHYEIGNIAVLPLGEHLQEHAIPVIVFETDAEKLATYRSQTAFQDAENVSKYRVEKMNKAFRDDEISLQRKQQVRKEMTDKNKVYFESLT